MSMLKRIPGGSRVVNVFSDFPSSQLKRNHPSFDHLSKSEKAKVEKFAIDYKQFIDTAKTSQEVVGEVEKIVSQSNDTGWTIFQNLDKTAFALLNPGQRSLKDGITIMYTHTDSPCLRAKVNPNGFNWDPEATYLHTGFELETFGQGGISPHQWSGIPIELRGWTISKDRIKRLNRLMTYSPDISAHTDERPYTDVKFAEAHVEEDLDLITGTRSAKEFVKKLGLEREEDFARSVVLGVPKENSHFVGKDYLAGYGHDNKSCLYSSVRAALETKPSFPSMVIGFDKEEVGSDGPGGANGKFFELALFRLMDLQNMKNLSSREELEMKLRSLAVDGDVDVAANSREIPNIDPRNIAKFGFGTFIYAGDGTATGDQISPRVVDYVVRKMGGVIQQTIGFPLPAQKSHELATMNEFMVRRGFPTINIGVPVGSLHSPSEILNIGDLYQTYRAYQKILDCKEKRKFDI